MPTNRPVETQDTISEILSWYSDIEELADEMRSWAESMEGTGLENTEKYGEVSEAADTLENAKSELEDACSGIKRFLEQTYGGSPLNPLNRTVRYTERKMYKGYYPPRWVRLANPVAALRAVTERLETLENEELKDYLKSLDSTLDDLDGVDFPSMY